MADLPKVYIYSAGRFGGPDGDYLMVAVAEDGAGLGSHICSSPAWAMGDLHDRTYRHAAYEAKFGGWGNGVHYDVVVVPDGQAPPDGAMDAIRRKNVDAEKGR